MGAYPRRCPRCNFSMKVGRFCFRCGFDKVRKEEVKPKNVVGIDSDFASHLGDWTPLLGLMFKLWFTATGPLITMYFMLWISKIIYA